MNKKKKVITEKDMQLIDVIQHFGYTHIMAKVVVYLLKYGKAFSKDIELTMNLRQPEVNVNIKELRAMDFVSAKKVMRMKGKGRPRYLYSLKKSKEEVMHQIETKARDEIEEIEHNLQELKQLI